jgi:hypothetical protein
MNLRRASYCYLVVAFLAGAVHASAVYWLASPELVRAIQIVTAALGNPVPYVVAAIYSLKIARDYPRGSRLATVWRLMALSAALWIVRYVFEMGMELLHLSDRYLATWTGLRQIPVNASLLALLVALALMWLSFARMGFGLSPRWTDCVLIAGICVFVPVILSYRSGLTDTQSSFAWIRALQILSPVLIGANAVFAVILYRINCEVGESGLARSIRFLALSLVARLFALFLQLPPMLRGSVPVEFVRVTTWLCVSTLFAIAVVERWSLSDGVSKVVRQYDSAAPTPEQLLEATARIASR